MQLFSIILGEKEILKGKKKKNFEKFKIKYLIFFFLVRVSVVCLHNAQND